MPIEEKTADVVTPEADATAEQNQQAAGLPEDVQKKLEYFERELKEVIKQRDELKRKTKENEDAKEKEKLEALQKAGKYEELNQELLRKQAEMEAERAELLTVREKFSIFEQQVKQDLLNKLPEAKRKFVAGFTIEDLKEFVALEEAQNPKVGTADAGRPGKGTIDISKITADSYSGLTPEQREELAQRYPQKYKEIYLQHSKRIKR